MCGHWSQSYTNNRFNGRLQSEYNLGTTYFIFSDHLGTTRVVTDATGAVAGCFDYLPFGGAITPPGCSGSGATNHLFTGKERDLEDNLDFFEARYNSSQLSRFMSPDPGNAGADLSNPQSWNMYAYVLNNPLTFVDPFGLSCTDSESTLTGLSNVITFPDQTWDPRMIFPTETTTMTVNGDCNPTFDIPFAGIVYLPLQPPPTEAEPYNPPLEGSLLPNNGEPPSSCELANISAVNAVSKLNVSVNNVVGEPFVFNGGLNVNFSIPGAAPGSLPPGRYPSSLLDSIVGIGSSLHVTSPGGADPSTYGVDPATGDFTFTTHIDTAYATWHTPIGAFLHWFTDVRDAGAHRTQCGGAG